jgi:hypothetical protein
MPEQQVFLFKDKDGIYLSDLKNGKDTLIYRADKEQIFLDEPYTLINDILTFGIKGRLEFNSDSESYSKIYYSLDLSNGRYWISSKIIYTAINKQLDILSLLFDSKGNLISSIDSVTEWKSTTSSYKGVEYNEITPRFYSKHELNDKVVFSLKGSIYYVYKSDTILIAENDKVFDPKFGNGYSQPQIDPKCEYVICYYNPGIFNFFLRRSLKRINLADKEILKIKNGVFGNPKFSNDGNYLLFKRNSRVKNNSWISDIYIMDLNSKKEIKIGEADIAYWKK